MANKPTYLTKQRQRAFIITKSQDLASDPFISMLPSPDKVQLPPPFKVIHDLCPTFEGYVSLIEEFYFAMSARSIGYALIPFSLFQYYCMGYLYLKLNVLCADNFFNMPTKFSCSQSNILPSPIHEYFRAIDKEINWKDLSCKFNLFFTPNADGHFGKIDSTTHWKYMSFPAPAVVYQRMIADIKYTRGEGGQIWEIPEIRPDSDQCGHPTPNLLGWGPAVKLTSNQLIMLESELKGKRSRTPIFQFIHVLNLGKKFIPSESSGKGSLVLFPFLSVRSNEKLSPSKRYIDLPVTVNSFLPCSASMVAGAALGAYRVKRLISSELNPWAVYSWNDYTCVPEDWKATANNVFDHGMVESILNIDCAHISEPIQRRLLIHSWFDSYMPNSFRLNYC